MTTDKTVLVTGATGFVGAYLLRYLLKAGYTEILAMKRKNSPMDLVAEIQDKVQWVEGDILDIIFLEDVMKGVDQVYHAAAVISMNPREKEMMFQVNIEGTTNVVNAALHEGIEKMVFLSSIAAIGRTKNVKHINEKTKWEESKFNSNYAESKMLAEREVWRGIAEGLNAAIINPAVILGSGFWKKGTCVTFSRVWSGLMVYPGGASGYVDVRDVARMCIDLMEKDIHSERFIAVGENMSYQKLFTMVANFLGKKPPAFELPVFIGEIAWRILGVLSFITRSTPMLTREMVQLTARTYIYDNTKSKEQLGFEYTAMEDCFKATCEQLKAAAKENFAAKVLPV